MRALAKTISAEANGAPCTTMENTWLDHDVTISCYEDIVPAFVEQELNRLYQNLHSSLMHYAVRKKAHRASTYIAHRNGQPISILLFNRKKQSICVINEMIDIPNEELQRFASYIFSRYKFVARISFSLIGKEIGRLPFPCQRHDGSEDIVLVLPSTPQAYLESLSPKTRRNIRRYLRAIAHDKPTFRCESAVGKQINEQDLHDLIHLKKINIGAKNLKFGLDEEELQWIVHQAKLTGMVTVITIDGKVCGGSINLRIGNHFFGQIIAYDPAYQKYSLGFLSTYLTICDQILLGGKESHLCWGRYAYKYKLAGIQRDRGSLDIYRSHGAYCCHAGAVLAKAIKTCVQDGKRRLLDMEHEEGKTAQAGAMLVRVLRKIKRSRVMA